MRFLLCALALTGTLITGVARADEASGPQPDRQERISVMEKINTGFIVEVGALLNMDTAGTIQLAGRLKPFSKRRMKLRIETWDATEQLKRAAKQHNGEDVPGLARTIARDRVELAKVDQQELDELLKGLSPEQQAKVAVFALHYQKHVEQLAKKIIEEHMGHPGGDADSQPPHPGE